MLSHEHWMRRCLELAGKFSGHTAPNPMVGAVIVHDGEIIGEGAHELYGGPHAEVNAISRVQDQQLLKSSVIYVSLEPCAHHGKTPPCADLIISKNIPRVVIGAFDSNPLVGGKGIERMRKAGIDVVCGVMENEARFQNRRFFTFHEKKRPYIILKWAQSSDGFIDHDREAKGNFPAAISSLKMSEEVHRWRAEEAAILVGTNTALLDNPKLTVRLAGGKNPLRVVIDRTRKIPLSSFLFDGSAETLVVTEGKCDPLPHVSFVQIDFGKDILPQLMDELYNRKILSLLVEGGTKTIESFFRAGLCDEIRRIVSPKNLIAGVKSPSIETPFDRDEYFDGDRCLISYTGGFRI